MQNGGKMTGDLLGWQGAPCLLPPAVSFMEPNNEMTLVVALQGQSEIVIAADSMVHDGDSSGMYKFDQTKLLKVGDRWLFASAGTQVGYVLHKQIEREGFDASASIHEAVHKYAARMCDLYRERGYRGDAAMILAGVSNGEPGIYGWSIERDAQERINFSGAIQRPHRTSIGAYNHGTLYFANAFHTPQMDTRQRILLAYFCVREAAKYDPRVGGNIEVALITEGGVRMFASDELAEVERAGVDISERLKWIF